MSNASRITTLLLAAAAGCTLNVKAVSTELHAEHDEPGWHTLRVGGGIEGRLAVHGREGSGAEALAVVERLVVSDGNAGEEVLPRLAFDLDEEGVLELVADCDGCAESLWISDVKIEVNEQAALDLETLAGGVEVSGARAPVRASSRSGDVQVLSTALVSVESGSGDVRVESGGRAVVTTGSGDIRVQSRAGVDLRSSSGDVKVSGRCGSVHTESGDIVAAFEEQAQLSTSSGDIDAEIAGGGRVKTSSGRVEVTLNGAGFATLEVETASGDVTVHLPACEGFELELSSSSGDIEIDTRAARTHTDGSYSGRLAGGGPLIRVSTSSGDIRVVD